MRVHKKRRQKKCWLKKKNAPALEKSALDSKKRTGFEEKRTEFEKKNT